MPPRGAVEGSGLLCLAFTLSACLDPNLTRRDRAFEGELRQAVTARPIGPIPAPQARALLNDLFGARVTQVCVVHGGDWIGGVRAQWSKAPSTPIPTRNLVGVGSGELGLDGLVALVGIDERRRGHVRRGYFSGGDCSDHAEGPVCWSVSRLEVQVVEGRSYDAGPAAGTRGRALRLSDVEGVSTSCPIEPYPE